MPVDLSSPHDKIAEGSIREEGEEIIATSVPEMDGKKGIEKQKRRVSRTKNTGCKSHEDMPHKS